MSTHSTPRTVRRGLLGGFVSIAGALAVASIAAACAAIDTTGRGHYLDVTPNAGAAAVATPVAVAGYLLSPVSGCIPDSASCPPAPSGTGDLYRSAALGFVALTQLDDAIHGGHGVPATCASDIGDVSWKTSGNNVVVVGSGTMPSALTMGAYFVCAEPAPNLLWNYFFVV